MKFQIVLAAIALGVTAAYDEVTECPATEYAKLAPLAINPSLDPCQTAANWQMLPPTGYPNATQLATMCETTECFDLIAAVSAINPSDCVLVFGDVKMNVKKLAEEFEPSCFA
uniref:Elicitin n=1 Tax=Globisporangium ultimum (strain ATCC 200006 / CBS 805.95 / DAOM BR144) TaxID=431595 RepID=K3WWP0_GLOUD